MKNFFLNFGFLNLLCLSLTLPFMAHAAAPVVNAVTGSTGETLVISGSNMVNEDRANWDAFFTGHPKASGFEGLSLSADGYTPVQTSTTLPGYDATVKLMGSKSMRASIQGASSISPYNIIASYAYMVPQSCPNGYCDMWLRWYARFNLISGSWPNPVIKHMYNLKNYYFGPSPGGSPLPTTVSDKIGAESHKYPIPLNPDNGQLENNRWYLFELHWNTSTTPAVWEAWMDGVQMTSTTTSVRDQLKYILFGIPNAAGTTSNFALEEWWDGLAISSTGHRIYAASKIEISNNPSYGVGVVRYQEPLFLSDESIKIKADFTGLGSGPYYLWVTNNKQERSTPYKFSSNGGTPAIILSAPVNLIVQ